MRLSLSTLACAAGLALGLALPAAAAPIGAPSPALNVQASQQGGLLHLVQGGEGEGAGAFSPRRQWESQGGWRGRDSWRGRDHWRHRDDRRWRHHWRGAPSIFFDFAPMPYIIAPPPPVHYVPRRHVHRLSSAHVAWCQRRYRSYRVWDNTFQPYHGPRRACISPYY